MKNFRGFTLVELMIVVAIVGILGLMGGLTTIKALPGYQLKKAAREMVTSLRQARSMAIKLNRSITVTFNVSDGKYALDGKSPLDGKPLSIAQTLTQYYGSGVRFGFPGRSDCVHFTLGSSTGPDAGDDIVFNTRGLTEKTTGQAGVVGYVYIQNSRGQGYRIGVSGLAGNIKMDQCGSVDCTTNPQ